MKTSSYLTIRRERELCVKITGQQTDGRWQIKAHDYDGEVALTEDEWKRAEKILEEQP